MVEIREDLALGSEAQVRVQGRALDHFDGHFRGVSIVGALAEVDGAGTAMADQGGDAIRRDHPADQ